MITHASRPGETTAACGATDATVITLDEALSADGRYFDCPECLKTLRGSALSAKALRGSVLSALITEVRPESGVMPP